MKQGDFAHVQASIKTAPISADDHRATLDGVMAAISAGDFDSLRQHLAHDVELHIHGFPSMDCAEKGCSSVISRIKSNFAQVFDQKPQVEAFIHSGDSAAMLFRETGIHRLTGQPYDCRVVIWYTFEHDKLKRIEEFVHSLK